MRYIHSILYTEPFFIAGTVWVAMQLSWPLMIFSVLGGVLLGILMSTVLYHALTRDLLEGKSSFLTRNAPGGVWFFLGAGVFGGCLLGMMMGLPQGKTIVLVIIECGGSAVSLMFLLLGWRILNLEKKHHRKVMMGPLGLYIDEDSTEQ